MPHSTNPAPDAIPALLQALTQCLHDLDSIGARVAAAHVDTAIQALAADYCPTPGDTSKMERSSGF